MFAKYITNVSSTQTQVINDIGQLLSGASIASLSASCDKDNTTLLSTVAPGWTLYDAAGPSSSVILSAPDADATTTKYVQIRVRDTTNMEIAAYETWNTTTKTGTNIALAGLNSVNGNASIHTLSYSNTAVNVYAIFATPRSFLVVFIRTPENSNTSGLAIGSFEFTREAAYLIGSTYPCFCVGTASVLSQAINSAGGGNVYAGTSAIPLTMGVPRMKNLFASGDLTGTSSRISFATLVSKYTLLNSPYTASVDLVSQLNTVASSSMVDNNNNQYREIRPIFTVFVLNGINSVSNITQQPFIGKVYDIFDISNNTGNNLDTISDGINTYVIVNISTCTFAFKLA